MRRVMSRVTVCLVYTSSRRPSLSLRRHEVDEGSHTPTLTLEQIMARVRNRYAGSFTVHLSDVQEICKRLESEVGKPRLSAECSDDIQRAFTSLSELESYVNPTSKAITKLAITSLRPWDQSDASIGHAAVYFGSNGDILIDVEGKEQDSVELRNALKDIVDGTKNWFTFITKSLNPIAPIVIISLGWPLALFYYVRDASTIDLARTSSGEVPFPIILLVAITAGLMFFVTVFVVPIVLGRLQNWLFPATYFALGQGERRNQIREKVRWGLVLLIPGIVVSVVLFLVSRII